MVQKHTNFRIILNCATHKGNFRANFFFSDKKKLVAHVAQGKIELLSLVYNKSSFRVFKTKNVENVETRNYQRLFKIENVEENV